MTLDHYSEIVGGAYAMWGIVIFVAAAACVRGVAGIP